MLSLTLFVNVDACLDVFMDDISPSICAKWQNNMLDVSAQIFKTFWDGSMENDREIEKMHFGDGNRWTEKVLWNFKKRQNQK